MTVEFELVTEIAASPQRCFDVSCNIDAHLGSMEDSNERAVAGVTSGQIGLGETVTWNARHFGIPWTMTSRIVEYDPPRHFVDEQLKGPFSRFRHEHAFEPTAVGTRMVDRVHFDAPFGPLGDAVEKVILGTYLRRLIQTRNDYLRHAAEGNGG
jgi:ligand-binding SRPBCC domain-containing protein